MWPIDRSAAAPAAVLAGAAGTGLVGALVLMVGEPGIAWLLTAVPLLLTAVATARGGLRPGVIGWAAAAVALAGVGAVRASGWLFLLCLPAAVLCGLLAITRGRTWTGLLTGVLAGPTALGTTGRWTFNGLRRTDGADRGLALRALVVGAITVALLAVFGVLLAGADPLFSKLLTALLPTIGAFDFVSRPMLFVLVTVVTLVASLLAHRRPAFDRLAPRTGTPRALWEWAVPLGALDALLTCFVLIQIARVVDGENYVLATAGLTYADFARQGFWQLLAVVALTLGVVAGVLRAAGGSEAIHRKWLRLLLGGLCVLAMAVVVVALRRMWIYEDVYGLTRLRLLVEAAEIWLGVVFLLILAAGVRWRAGWLPRAVLGTGVATLLGLAALNPDGLIAAAAADRFERTHTIDTAYLEGLSPDAVPELDRLPEPQRSCVLAAFSGRLLEDGGETWSNVNAARVRARTVLTEHPLQQCDFANR